MSKTVLVIDDLVPHPRYGAGYGRAHDIVASMLAQGCRVLICARARRPLDKECLDFLLKGDVKALYLNERSLADVFEEFGNQLDLVWVSRTPNIDRFSDIVLGWKQKSRNRTVVADTEALTSLRKFPLSFDVYAENNKHASMSAVAGELSKAQKFDYIVCVNNFEAQLAQSVCSSTKVITLAHSFQVCQSGHEYGRRHHMVFLGAFHTMNAPNMDAVTWFCSNVWPRIADDLPNVEFHIAGYISNTIKFPEIVHHNAKILGPVNNLASFFSDYRVFVAPTRFAAGIPHKVQEAMSHGLPAVVSEILAKQLPRGSEKAPFISSSLDGQQFAEKCMSLYTDAALWETVQASALQNIQENCSPEHFSSMIAHILFR